MVRTYSTVEGVRVISVIFPRQTRTHLCQVPTPSSSFPPPCNMDLRTRHSLDSWVEISSQPSTSSLSSAAASDEIITTGLRVQRRASDPSHRSSRRRRLERLAAITTAQVEYSSREPSVASSSQDEYEESESDSDRVLTSSNEDLRLPLPRRPRFIRAGPSPAFVDISSDDEDDDATALGMRINSTPFVPQPNAFSHPPASRDPSWTSPTELRRNQPSGPSDCSRVAALRSRTDNGSNSSRRQQQHSPFNMVSPSYHADHDAALRASLSTLLSCAAAARGLPKQDSQPATVGGSRARPSSFRLVPESIAMGEESSEEEDPSSSAPAVGPQRSDKVSKPVAARTTSPTSKAKRRSSSPKDRGTSRRSRRTNLANSTGGPTFMTWVISTGVVVIFSAISFSAGYVLGREVGRTEMMLADGGVGGFSGSRATTECV